VAAQPRHRGHGHANQLTATGEKQHLASHGDHNIAQTGVGNNNTSRDRSRATTPCVTGAGNGNTAMWAR